MSILVGRETRLLVQGVTGREGSFHARQMQDYGTVIVAGVTPGRGGQRALDGSVPVFDTCAEAVRETGANTSVIYVPAAGVLGYIIAQYQHGKPFRLREPSEEKPSAEVYALMREQAGARPAPSG